MHIIPFSQAFTRSTYDAWKTTEPDYDDDSDVIEGTPDENDIDDPDDCANE